MPYLSRINSHHANCKLWLCCELRINALRVISRWVMSQIWINDIVVLFMKIRFLHRWRRWNLIKSFVTTLPIGIYKQSPPYQTCLQNKHIQITPPLTQVVLLHTFKHGAFNLWTWWFWHRDTSEHFSLGLFAIMWIYTCSNQGAYIN